MSSAQRANRRGKQLEPFVGEELEDAGYERIKPSSLIFAMKFMDQPIYTSQVKIGHDMYGKSRRVDFLLFHPILHFNGLVIQCKWQLSSGSVEEKYPFEVQNIRESGYDTIILLDGGGYSGGAKRWFYSQAGHDHLLHVFDQEEFLRFIARGGIN